MKFAEFHTGQLIQAGPLEVSEAEIIQFATAYDPQWFHTDPASAAQGHFGGLIANGWHTCALGDIALALATVQCEGHRGAEPRSHQPV